MNTYKDLHKTGPRDVFLNLLGTICLYATVVGLGSLLFSLINIYFPDPLSGTGYHSETQTLRFPLAILVVAFPLFLWLTSFLERDISRNPEQRELKTRKWLLYFTLFAATIVIAGDLISLIVSYLNGELTIRFALKASSVFATAAGVFIYYSWHIRKTEPPSSDIRMKIFARGAVAIIALTIIFGFYVAGYPGQERMRRFDEERVYNLEQTQTEIISYWQAKEMLPRSLDMLYEPLRGFSAPKDPATSEPYEYRVLGDKAFVLCAKFSTSNKDAPERNAAGPAGREFGEQWQHESGRVCFERTIDPDRFPTLKEIRKGAR